MTRDKLILAIGIVLLLAAGGTAVVVLSNWKNRAQLNAGADLYNQLMALYAATEAQYGIPPDLLARQGFAESSFNPAIIDGSEASSAGAIGIAQFEPATAAQYGVADPTDPAQAIPGQGHYLSDLYREFGSWRLALAAYDAGAGNVTKYKGIPPFPETQSYVSKILADLPGVT